MNKGGKQRIRLQIILICFLLSCVVIIVTIPLHEAAHWIMSDIDPYSEPVEFHLFDFKSPDNGQHILLSALGSVTIKEAYPGSFKDRPIWIDLLQELICISVQILITCIIVAKTLKLLFYKNHDILRTSR
jgi:hypothetical protein